MLCKASDVTITVRVLRPTSPSQHILLQLCGATGIWLAGTVPDNCSQQCKQLDLNSVRFEVFTAANMKNVVFWDIKAQFVPHRRHNTSPLQSPASLCYVRFEVFTAVAMKNVVFWDLKPQFVPHRRHIAFPLQSPAS
jgi:hypothetical protein